jgi:hypothetical protein
MIGIIIATVSIIVTLLVLWQQYQIRDRSHGPSSLKALRSGNGVFRSVGVDAGGECCEAVKELAGSRFLMAEAPRLPLAECTLETCSCRYIYFPDRRATAEDRRDLSAPRDGSAQITPLRELRENSRRQD